MALHEYSAPVMQYGVGDNQWNGGQFVLNDPADDHDELGWWTLRYRRSVAEWRKLGLETIPPIIITESGIDDIQPRPGPAGKGWRETHGDQPLTWRDEAGGSCAICHTVPASCDTSL